MYAITLICSYFRDNNTNTTNKTKHVMKKKIDLRKLLQLLGKGTKLYSPAYGDVFLESISFDSIGSPEICVNRVLKYNIYRHEFFDRYGCILNAEDAEVMLFPSREERDWEEYINKYRIKQYNENMLDFFNTYCEANGKDKDSVVEAMLWMRDRIMKEMKYMVSDANIGNCAIMPCGDGCDAELDVDVLSEHINAEIMDMF